MKSWISKALLGLCLGTSTAMASLPTIPNRYSAIKLSTTGFSNQQISNIKNGFGLIALTNTNDYGVNFRFTGSTGDPDFVTSVRFNLIHGAVPGSGNCTKQPNYLCDNYTITARSVSNPTGPRITLPHGEVDVPETYDDVIVNFYDRVNRSSSAGGDVVWKGSYDSLTFQNINLFQNAMTDIWSFIFCPSRPRGNGGSSGLFVYQGLTNRNPPYTSKVVVQPLRYLLELNYGQFNGSNAIGILDFDVMDATNTTVVGKKYLIHTATPQQITTNMRLKWARNLVAFYPSGDPASKKVYLNGGRIGIKDVNNQVLSSCYPFGIPGTLPTYYTSSDWDLYRPSDLEWLIAAGLRSQNLERKQESYGDLLTNITGGSCTTGMGYVGDVMQ